MFTIQPIQVCCRRHQTYSRQVENDTRLTKRVWCIGDGLTIETAGRLPAGLRFLATELRSWLYSLGTIVTSSDRRWLRLEGHDYLPRVSSVAKIDANGRNLD
eukprot:SAG31_NODE_1389_length_8545_cov_3.081103_11_plen_102_part_00